MIWIDASFFSLSYAYHRCKSDLDCAIFDQLMGVCVSVDSLNSPCCAMHFLREAYLRRNDCGCGRVDE